MAAAVHGSRLKFSWTIESTRIRLQKDINKYEVPTRIVKNFRLQIYSLFTSRRWVLKTKGGTIELSEKTTRQATVYRLSDIADLQRSREGLLLQANQPPWVPYIDDRPRSISGAF